MRRQLSDAVQIRPPRESILLVDSVSTSLPTESEVRDGALRLAASLKEMVQARTAGQDGWRIGDLDFQLVNLEHGEIALRGTVIIERPD